MIERFIADLAHGLGAWAYLLVAGMAYMETAAFAGLVAPGEIAVLVGGVLAGEGTLSIYVLCGLVWLAAVLGDTTGFFLGRRLGRNFLLRHGPKVRINEERLAQVDRYFERHGGKTILIGRFIGFVRPLMPFLAGASGMQFRRFFPYDLLSAGAWSTIFAVLGYVFWRSFAQVSAAAGKGTLIFGATVVTIVVVIALVRRLRKPEVRGRVRAWAERQMRRPGIRPIAAALRPVWRAVAPQLRFLAQRLAPGSPLGLEFTTLLAASAIGSYVFALYTSLIVDGARLTPADEFTANLVAHIRTGALTEIAKILSAFGSLGAVATIVAVSCIVLVWRRLRIEAIVLLAGAVLTPLAVQIAKHAIDRPRPVGGLVDAAGPSFPSGHAAYAVAYVALALVAWMVAPRWTHRVAMVVAAVVFAALIGASRVYLGVHYWSDVAAGWALAVTVYATCGAFGMIAVHLRNESPRDRDRSPP